MFTNQSTKWINQQGQPVRPLSQRQKEYMETPFYQLALQLYKKAEQANLPLASTRLAEINRMLDQLAEQEEPSYEDGLVLTA